METDHKINIDGFEYVVYVSSLKGYHYIYKYELDGVTRRVFLL